MQRTRLSSVAAGALLVGALVLAWPSTSSAQGEKFVANLQGFNEVPSISSTGTGAFRATLSPDGLSLSYVLKFSGLSAAVTQSHIHFGQQHTAGAIMVFLCQTPGNPDPTGLAPQCVNQGSVDGTLTADNIIMAGNQGIGAGEFNEFVLALRGSSGYVNVHTMTFPGGEIRGTVTAP